MPLPAEPGPATTRPAEPGPAATRPAEPGPAAPVPAGGRTFHARKGRLSPAKRRALAELGPRLALGPDERPDAVDLGCGTGEAALALAADRPDWLVLAVDVHSASVASLLLAAAGAAAPNLRVHHGDGLELLRQRIRPGSLALLRVLFPDPWPKARHRHRRLVQPAFAALAADLLAPGGRLELATDRADYARQMAAVLAGDTRLSGGAPAEPRPPTYYEGRARAAGRAVHELCYRR
jgi:tRNA (guanine-N7-)-methyltransferase